MAITVAIIEGSAGLCQELTATIARDSGCFCVCACQGWRAETGRISRFTPDVIVMDINLPDGSGIEGVARLKRLLPHTQILIFSACDDHEQIFEALRAGASGYLLKRTAPRELLSAIHEIKRGGVPMSGEVARKVLQSFQRGLTKTEMTDSLTAREQEILQLLAEGGPSREMAQRLCISVDTVNSHLKHIYGKLQVRSRTEAVIKYLTSNHRASSSRHSQSTPVTVGAGKQPEFNRK